MSFVSQLNNSLTTYRLAQGAGVTKTYALNLTDVAVFIQPMSAEYSAKLGMTYGRSFNCYTQISVDIKKGDKVVDEDGTEYRVTGSLRRKYGHNPNATFWLTEQAGDGGV